MVQTQRARAAWLVLVASLLACRATAPGAGTPASAEAGSAGGEPPPVLQLPRDVRPTAYRLELDVDPEREQFSGRVEIDLVLDRARQLVWLHGLGLDVTSAELARKGAPPQKVRYEQVNEDGLARVVLPAPAPPGPATLRMTWVALAGSRLGLFRIREAGAWYAATQFEATYARRAFPGFDEPSFKVPFQVTLTVPAGLVAVSNAPEAGRDPAADGRVRIRFQATPPLPTYLVFAAVGPFDVVEAPLPENEVRPHPLPVRGLAPRGRGGELAWSLGVANQLLLDLERYFAIPFPYEKLDHVALPDLSFGAMENAGAIAYRARFLLAPASASEAARRDIALFSAHEMSHQWFGDLVTPDWWTEIWLNESFATWLGLRTPARVFPAWQSDLRLVTMASDAMAIDGLAAAGPVREPLRRMADVAAQFDALRYQKGGAVLGMLERWLGEATFRGAIRRYVAAHANGIGSTADLLAELSRASGRDVGAVAATFLDQPGVPLVQARPVCDASGARVELAQARWLPRGSGAARELSWKIPVCVRYEAAGAIRERCELLSTPAASIALPEGCPAWLMPNAGGAGYYRWSLPPADLARLMEAGVPRLSVAEKISLALAVDGARRAGSLAYAAALGAMATLARDPNPEVARLPMEFLAEAREQLVPAAAVPDVEAVTRALYRPALERLGWAPLAGEPPAATAFRGDVVGALVRTGRDPEVVRSAAALGARLLAGPGGTLDPSAVTPDLQDSALAAAVRAEGDPAYDALLARFEGAGPTLRPAMLHALGSPEGSELTARAVGLWREGRLGRGDRYRVLPFLVGQRATRGPMLAEVERNVDAMLDSFPEGTDAFFPELLSDGPCSEAEADRLRALLTPRLERRPAMRKSLAEALERIGLCAADRAADGEAAAAAYRALAEQEKARSPAAR